MVVSAIPPDSSGVPSGGGSSGSTTFTRDTIFSGGGAPLFDGDYIDLRIPADYTLSSIYLVSAASGSVTLDLQTTSYADFPSGFTSIIGSGTAPTISSAYKGSLTTFTDWDTDTLTSGNYLRILVDGNATGIEQLTVSIEAT